MKLNGEFQAAGIRILNPSKKGIPSAKRPREFSIKTVYRREEKKRREEKMKKIFEEERKGDSSGDCG